MVGDFHGQPNTLMNNDRIALFDVQMRIQLLALARTDTGSTSRRAGRIRARRCPVSQLACI